MTMKNIILLLTVLFLGLSVNAQTINNQSAIDTTKVKIYRQVDVLARNHAGYDAILKKIEDATKDCKRSKLRGYKDKAEVAVELLIDKKGQLRDVSIVKAEVDFCNEAILNALKETDYWIPAFINNRPVNSFLRLTINLQNAHSNRKINARTEM